MSCYVALPHAPELLGLQVHATTPNNHEVLEGVLFHFCISLNNPKVNMQLSDEFLPVL